MRRGALFIGVFLLASASLLPSAAAYDQLSPRLQAQILHSPTIATVPLSNSVQELLHGQFSTSVAIGVASADVVGYGFRIWSIDQQLSAKQVLGISLVQLQPQRRAPQLPAHIAAAFCASATNVPAAAQKSVHLVTGAAARFFSCGGGSSTQAVAFIKGTVVGVAFAEIPAFSSDIVLQVASKQYAAINARQLQVQNGAKQSSTKVWVVVLVGMAVLLLYWWRERFRALRKKPSPVPLPGDRHSVLGSINLRRYWKTQSRAGTKPSQHTQTEARTHEMPLDAALRDAPKQSASDNSSKIAPVIEKSVGCDHADRQPGDRHCPACGQQELCESCTQPLAHSLQFCPACGRKV